MFFRRKFQIPNTQENRIREYIYIHTVWIWMDDIRENVNLIVLPNIDKNRLISAFPANN